MNDSAGGWVGDLLEQADRMTDRATDSPVDVPLGMSPLDGHLGGGLATGDLALLAGAQGTGKTTLALQMARNAAVAGRPVTFVCYEHSAQTLLNKLVVLEANLAAGSSAPTLQEARYAALRGTGDTLLQRLHHLPGVAEGLSRMKGYRDRMRLVAGRGDSTGPDEIAALFDWHPGPGLVVVDYLQKVHTTGTRDEEVRISRIATGLKDLALHRRQAILALSALDRSGLGSRRIRARHLKGSTTLAYEADVVLLMQDKYEIVARERLLYDSHSAQDMHHWVVLSIDKNRHGDDQVDLVYRKRLDRAYIEPHGRIEQDELVDERIHLA